MSVSKELVNSLPSPAAFTVDEAAAYVSVSSATIWRLLKNKELPRARLRGRTVVRRVDLDALLAKSSEGSVATGGLE